MSTLDDIRSALGVLALGLSVHDTQPSMQAFEDAFASEAGQAALKNNVYILQCTSAYPTPLDQANIKAISTLKETFGLRTGFSDHTEGTIASLAAVALGAEIIEKHYGSINGLHRSSAISSFIGNKMTTDEAIRLAKDEKRDAKAFVKIQQAADRLTNEIIGEFDE